MKPFEIDLDAEVPVDPKPVDFVKLQLGIHWIEASPVLNECEKVTFFAALLIHAFDPEGRLL